MVCAHPPGRRLSCCHSRPVAVVPYRHETKKINLANGLVNLVDLERGRCWVRTNVGEADGHRLAWRHARGWRSPCTAGTEREFHDNTPNAASRRESASSWRKKCHSGRRRSLRWPTLRTRGRQPVVAALVGTQVTRGTLAERDPRGKEPRRRRRSSSGQESVRGQRKDPRPDARRVVGGIGDRGCCADNTDLAQSPSSRYA
jgi:hypothetical protein